MKPINLRIAKKLGVGEQQVAAAISLLDGRPCPLLPDTEKRRLGPSMTPSCARSRIG
jgi:hypothetical protein